MYTSDPTEKQREVLCPLKYDRTTRSYHVCFLPLIAGYPLVSSPAKTTNGRIDRRLVFV